MRKSVVLSGAAVLAAALMSVPAQASNENGCPRFANSDLSPAHLRQLRSAGYCDAPAAHAGGRTVVVSRTETVTRILDRGVSDGSSHSSDRLTAMGRAESDGAYVMRLRSSRSQTVNLRRVGGSTQTMSVDPGDTIVAVEGSGTYVADFTGSGTSQVKSTGGHTWDDVQEETVTTQERVEVESGADTR